MPHVKISSTKKNFEWKWAENSILNNISPYHSPKDIFDAVCFEIKRYYSGQESFKTYKRKVKWLGHFLDAEMAFWSSHSNMAGEFVMFTVVSNGYSKDSSGMEKKGLLYTWIHYDAFDVHAIDYKLFKEIIGYIDACVVFFKSIDSAEGFKHFIDGNDLARGESNNLIFLEKMQNVGKRD